MINKDKINEIKNKIQKNCRNCIYYNQPSFCYEEGYTEPHYCSKRDNVANLKSFPFKKEQKCFSVDTYLLDLVDEDLLKLYNEWNRFYEDKVLKKLSKLREERYGELI